MPKLTKPKTPNFGKLKFWSKDPKNTEETPVKQPFGILDDPKFSFQRGGNTGNSDDSDDQKTPVSFGSYVLSGGFSSTNNNSESESEKTEEQKSDSFDFVQQSLKQTSNQQNKENNDFNAAQALLGLGKEPSNSQSDEDDDSQELNDPKEYSDNDEKKGITFSAEVQDILESRMKAGSVAVLKPIHPHLYRKGPGHRLHRGELAGVVQAACGENNGTWLETYKEAFYLDSNMRYQTIPQGTAKIIDSGALADQGISNIILTAAPDARKRKYYTGKINRRFNEEAYKADFVGCFKGVLKAINAYNFKNLEAPITQLDMPVPGGGKSNLQRVKRKLGISTQIVSDVRMAKIQAGGYSPQI